MAETLSPAMQEALAAGRERFNALFAAARRGTDLDPAAFQAWIREGIAPAVDAAAAPRPEAAGPVLDALFERSLELVGAARPRRREPASPGHRGVAAPAARAAGAARRRAGGVERRRGERAAPPGGDGRGAARRSGSAAMLRAGPRVRRPGDVPRRGARRRVARRPGAVPRRRRSSLAAPPATRRSPRIALGLEAAAPRGAAGGARRRGRRPVALPEELREGPWGEPRLALVGRVGAFRGFGGPVPGAAARRGRGGRALRPGRRRVLAALRGLLRRRASSGATRRRRTRRPHPDRDGVDGRRSGAVRHRGLTADVPGAGRADLLRVGRRHARRDDRDARTRCFLVGAADGGAAMTQLFGARPRRRPRGAARALGPRLAGRARALEPLHPAARPDLVPHAGSRRRRPGSRTPSR